MIVTTYAHRKTATPNFARIRDRNETPVKSSKTICIPVINVSFRESTQLYFPYFRECGTIFGSMKFIGSKVTLLHDNYGK